MSDNWKKDLAEILTKVVNDCVRDDRLSFLEDDLKKVIDEFAKERLVRVYFMVIE